MKITHRPEHNFGVVYVVVCNINPVSEIPEVVEVYESEVHAEERLSKLQRQGVRNVVVVRRQIRPQ